MLRFSLFTFVALIGLAVAGCDKKEAAAPQPRPVRTVTVERLAEGETVSLTGQVRAKDEVSLAFRVGGRMLERRVNVGDVVQPGQVIAQLDPKDEQDALRVAQAKLGAVQAVLIDARSNLARKQELLKGGWVPRAQFDTAQQMTNTAQAEVDAARAQVSSAENQLSYTVLFADAGGVVTAKGAEPGEVVQAGQMIVRLARQGGRDAVFDVPEQLIRNGPRDPVVQLVLTNDPTVKATGRVREVSPQADPATRTWQVKVGIIDPPPSFALGATLTGSIKLNPPAGVEVPPSALTQTDGRPAVWVFDPKSQTVALRNVDVARYDPADVVISQGLEAGEIVVTAGVQVLRPGQKVRLLGAA